MAPGWAGPPRPGMTPGPSRTPQSRQDLPGAEQDSPTVNGTQPSPEPIRSSQGRAGTAPGPAERPDRSGLPGPGRTPLDPGRTPSRAGQDSPGPGTDGCGERGATGPGLGTPKRGQAPSRSSGTGSKRD